MVKISPKPTQKSATTNPPEYDNSWDLSGLEQSSEIWFELGYGIANSEDWPNWYQGTEFRALRDKMLGK